jgi:hypothetical protein
MLGVLSEPFSLMCIEGPKSVMRSLVSTCSQIRFGERYRDLVNLRGIFTLNSRLQPPRTGKSFDLQGPQLQETH